MTHLALLVFLLDLPLDLVLAPLPLIPRRLPLLFPPFHFDIHKLVDLLLDPLVHLDALQARDLALTRGTDEIIVQQVIVDAFFAVQRFAAGRSARGMKKPGTDRAGQVRRQGHPPARSVRGEVEQLPGGKRFRLGRLSPRLSVWLDGDERSITRDQDRTPVQAEVVGIGPVGGLFDRLEERFGDPRRPLESGLAFKVRVLIGRTSLDPVACTNTARVSARCQVKCPGTTSSPF